MVMADCSASVPIDRDSFQRYVPAQPALSEGFFSGAPEAHQQHSDPADVGLSAEALALPTPDQQHGDGECPAAGVVRYSYALRPLTNPVLTSLEQTLTSVLVQGVAVQKQRSTCLVCRQPSHLSCSR